MESESDLETVNFSDVEVEVVGNEAADAPLDDPNEEAEQAEEGGPSALASPQTPDQFSMAARLFANRESKMKKVKDAALEAKSREEEQWKEDEERRRALEVNAKRAQNAKKLSKKKAPIPMPSETIVVHESDDEIDDEIDAEFARGTQALEAKAIIRESPVRKMKKKDVVSDDEDGKKEIESHELQKSRSNTAKKGLKRSTTKRKKGITSSNAEVDEVENGDMANRTENARQLAEADYRDGVEPHQDGESPVLSQRKGRTRGLRSQKASLLRIKPLYGAARITAENKKRREEEERRRTQNIENGKDVEEGTMSSIPMNQEQPPSNDEEKVQTLSTANGAQISGEEEEDGNEDGKTSQGLATEGAEANRKREAELKKQKAKDERKKKAEEKRKQREAEALRKKEDAARLKTAQAHKRLRTEEGRRRKEPIMLDIDDEDAFLDSRSGKGRRSTEEVVVIEEEGQVITAMPNTKPSNVTAGLSKRKRGRPKKIQLVAEELPKKRKVGVAGDDTLNTQEEVPHGPGSSDLSRTGENPVTDAAIDVPSGSAGVPQELGRRKGVTDRRSGDATPTVAKQLSAGLEATESAPSDTAQKGPSRVETEGQGDESTDASPIEVPVVDAGVNFAEATGSRRQSGSANPEQLTSASTKDGDGHEAMAGISVPPQSEPSRTQADKANELVSSQRRARVSDGNIPATIRDTNASNCQQNAEPAFTGGHSYEKLASAPPENRSLHLHQLVPEKDELAIVKTLLDDLQTDDLEHVELQGERIDKTITKLTQHSKAARSKSLADVRRGGMSEVKQFLRRRKFVDDIEAAKLALRTAQQQALVAFAEAISASLRNAHRNGSGALSDMIGMKMDARDEGLNNVVENSANHSHLKSNSRAHGEGHGAANPPKRSNGTSAGKGAANGVGHGNVVNLGSNEIPSGNTAREKSQRRSEIVEVAAALAHSMVGAANRTNQLPTADKGRLGVKDTPQLPILKTMQAVKLYAGTDNKYCCLNLKCPRSEAILMMCERQGGVQLEELFEALPFSRRIIETKLADLQKKGFISGSYINRGNESLRVFNTVSIADSS